MAKNVALKSLLAFAGAAIALGATSAAQAQTPAARKPQVNFIPVAEAPQPPPGLQVACLSEPSDTGAPASKTCPVIDYGPGRTWVYSYADNRISFALVTYDSTGKILQNIEKPGGRYIFDIYVGAADSTLLLIGQSKASVKVNWSDLPH